MRKFEKFLFFYALFATTVFLISTAAFSPTPLNLVSGLLLFPVTFYFWLRITNPSGVSFPTWSFRFLVIVLCLSFLGVFAYFLSTKEKSVKPLSETDLKLQEVSQKIDALSQKPGSDELSKDIEEIKEELSRIKGTSNGSSSTLSEILSEKDSLGKIKVIGPEGQTVEVFEESAFSSRKTGQVEKGAIFSYFGKEGTWYEIELEGGQRAWLNGDFAEEIK